MSKKAKEIERLYDKTADIYDSRYRKIQVEKFKIILRYRKKNGLILDCGCGSGLLYPYIKDSNYIGIDLSKKMLEKHPLDCNLIQADAKNLPFLDNIFDEIFSITVFQNIEDRKKAMAEIERVMKKEGRLYLSILRKNFSKDLITFNSNLELVEKIDQTNLEDVILIFEKN